MKVQIRGITTSQEAHVSTQVGFANACFLLSILQPGLCPHPATGLPMARTQKAQDLIWTCWPLQKRCYGHAGFKWYTKGLIIRTLTSVICNMLKPRWLPLAGMDPGSSSRRCVESSSQTSQGRSLKHVCWFPWSDQTLISVLCDMWGIESYACML